MAPSSPTATPRPGAGATAQTRQTSRAEVARHRLGDAATARTTTAAAVSPRTANGPAARGSTIGPRRRVEPTRSANVSGWPAGRTQFRRRPTGPGWPAVGGDGKPAWSADRRDRPSAFERGDEAACRWRIAPPGPWPSPGPAPRRRAAGSSGRYGRRSRRRRGQVGGHDGELALARERHLAGEALVRHAGQRVLVARAADRGPGQLLRRAVGDRADDLARCG